MSKRATTDYVANIRVRRISNTHVQLLYLTDDELSYMHHGKTPKSLPPAMVVSKVEFVRERVFEHGEQVLHDYRVHFKDGTYDLYSITPVMDPPVPGKHWSRIDALKRHKIHFVTWEE